jgi:hypothetical protein
VGVLLVGLGFGSVRGDTRAPEFFDRPVSGNCGKRAVWLSDRCVPTREHPNSSSGHFGELWQVGCDSVAIGSVRGDTRAPEFFERPFSGSCGK